MATTSDFRNGLCIEYNGDLYTVVEFQHRKPGKGAAYVRTKLKNLKNGKVIEKNFPAGHKITTARVEKRPYQFLYSDDMGYHFMDSETFDQVTLPSEMVSQPDMMKEGMEVYLSYHVENEQYLGCELPQFVHMQVTYTEPGVKGDTATSTYKPATVETGATVHVPLFIEQDEIIKVDTRNREYVERVK